MKSLRVPSDDRLESATVRRWRVQPGDLFATGDVLVELELDASHVHVEAPVAGVLASTSVQRGATVVPGMVLGEYREDATAGTTEESPADEAPTKILKNDQQQEQAVSESKSGHAEREPDAAGGDSGGGGDAGKATPILMPEAGNSMEEGTLLEWKIAAGETIEAGQVIAEIETDKAVMDFEAPDGGRVARLIAKENDIVPVKQAVAVIADVDADADAWIAENVEGGAGGPSDETAPTDEQAGVAGDDLPDPEGEVISLLLPEVGNSMEEGTIIEWKVSEGDTIAVGDVIFELETDKSVMEIEATDAGRLARIVHQAGETVPVKTPVAYIAESDEDVDRFIAKQSAADTTPKLDKTEPKVAPADSAAPAVTAAATTVSPTRPAPTPSRPTPAPAATGNAPLTDTGRIKASPAARRLAAARGIDLAAMGPGSGPGGRILSTDVASAQQTAAPATAAEPAVTLTGPTGDAVAAGQVVDQSITKMRKAIAANLVASKQSVPHFYVKMTIDAGPLFRFYKAQKPATNCSLNDVIVLAVGHVMAEFPGFRSQWHGDHIKEFPEANVGIAVGVPDGLVVPVALGVDRHSLASLVPVTKSLVAGAREGRVDNMGKGNFTISNMGMFGVEDFQAIINPPESGILAVSAVRETVIVKDGAMRPGKVMSMTLSADHRVVDGALGAEFVARLKAVLENPTSLP